MRPPDTGDRLLGELTKKSYQIAQDFRLPARRAKGRIAGLCNPLRNTVGGRKDKQAGNFFDRNRLNRTFPVSTPCCYLLGAQVDCDSREILLVSAIDFFKYR